MIRDLFTLLYGVCLALGLGIGSAIWATDRPPVLGELVIGGWAANPGIGGDNPDPYSQAYFSRSGGLPLAAAEGLAFTRRADDGGDMLDAACSYLVEGSTPNARRWTLQVLRDGLPYSTTEEGVPVSAHSLGVLREHGGTFAIRIAAVPQPGNWVYAGPSGAFSLVLSLYDTSVANNTGLNELRMPAVTKLGCANG
jgi:hypothetical protein